MACIVCAMRLLLDSQFCEVFRRPCEYCLLTSRDNRALDELRIFGHHLNEFIISQISIRDVFLISGFILTDGVMRFESGAVQQALQFGF